MARPGQAHASPVRAPQASAAAREGSAITQIRHSHGGGRAYYDKKLAEGKTCKEALRSLKRRISNAIYASLQADARQAAGRVQAGPGRATGERP